MNSSKELRHCKDCGQELNGRNDKVVCSKKCYNRFYNELRRNSMQGLKPSVKSFERTYLALVKYYENSKGQDYIPLYKLMNAGFELDSPSNKCKINHFEHEIIRIANYGYFLHSESRSIIIFKFKTS